MLGEIRGLFLRAAAYPWRMAILRLAEASWASDPLNGFQGLRVRSSFSIKPQTGSAPRIPPYDWPGSAHGHFPPLTAGYVGQLVWGVLAWGWTRIRSRRPERSG